MVKQQFCRIILGILGRINLSRYIPDKLYLQMLYRQIFNKKLDLKNPKTFNEKLQWMKLYDRRPEYTTMVDKYAVKKYVAEKIGEEYIIPTLGVWNSPEEIDWDELPNQFVLKCTHDSGGLVICRDKSKLDKGAAIEKLRASLKRDYYKAGREWPYKNVPRRIIAEKYMEVAPNLGDLPDYKVFNFSGEPKLIELDYDRFVNHMRNIYTADWELTDIKIDYPSDKDRTFDKPQMLEELKELCRKLSAGIPFVRSDFYIVDKKLYFGELTFFPEGGNTHLQPENYQEILGDWILLPAEGNGGGKILICKKNNLLVVIRFQTKPAGDLPDYKFFCFDGVVKALFIGTERGTGDVKFDYYDADFNHLDLVQEHPMSGKDLPKPQHFEKMKDLASKLSKGMPQVRVDFYNINGKIYFGELTFFHHGGVIPFHPESWDYTFGSWIKLPNKTNNKY